MAPHIAAPIPVESATQTARAVTVTAKAVTEITAEGAAKAIACATATMTAAAGKCAGGKPGTSENKDNCKKSYRIAQH